MLPSRNELKIEKIYLRMLKEGELMKILGLKPGHDGAIALIDGERLEFSLEAEKNSFPRYSSINVSSILDAAKACKSIPDCIAVGGWPKGFHSEDLIDGMGYWGVGKEHEHISNDSFFGQDVKLFMGTHESSHVWCAFGLAPFADQYPCHVLVWEGNIGRFYRLNSPDDIEVYPQILDDPGNKYSFIFSLADPSYQDNSLEYRFQDAGKLMALAAYGEDHEVTREEADIISWVLKHPQIAGTRAKEKLKNSPFYNIGVQSQKFKNLARAHSDAIFNSFLDWAKQNLEPGLPLAIGGGCGLNCEWNSSWLASGLFTDVFVPPCVNDSGSAIGVAIQAKLRLTGKASVKWHVNCGSLPRDRTAEFARVSLPARPVNLDEVVSDLCDGHVIAVMRGCCEIGPRALGSRSLIADARRPEILDRLNSIKDREEYRPIAPICTAEGAHRFFKMPKVDKYMLFFSEVVDNRLPAVTHVDGSARVQVVEYEDNKFIWSLLQKFEKKTDVPVLCNTSLNFNGKGFIDDVGELIQYCSERGIERAICDDTYFEIPRNKKLI